MVGQLGVARCQLAAMHDHRLKNRIVIARGRIFAAESGSAPDQVLLTAGTSELREWLKESGESLWRDEPLLVARRVE